MRDGYTFIVARRVPCFAVFLGLLAPFTAQNPPEKLKQRKPEQPRQQVEQEPPEEDPGLKETEYSFNPLQAQKEMTAGAFYYKKGNYKAAARRFLYATKWDPTSAEAFRRLGESEEKLKDRKAAADAYRKFLELAPDGKEADSIRKKLGRK